MIESTTHEEGWPLTDQVFDKILKKASKAIGPEYFLLESVENPPHYRERVYCYELYHQMRKEFDKLDFRLRLNGEVDKGSHSKECVKNKKPDFIVHQPGSNEKNYAVIEVKSLKGLRKDSLKKDLETIMCFMTSLTYKRGIFLVYGEDFQRKFLKYESLFKCNEYKGIEVWSHLSPQKEADLYRICHV